MSKKKILLFSVGTAVLLILSFTFIIFKINNVYAAKSSKYELLEKFTNVMSIVQENYVEKVDNERLINGAIKGMLQELDPHSNYFDKDTFKEFQIETKGEFGGLGITIGIKDNILTVIAPLEDTPAWKAGLKAGDKIIKINGKSTANITLEEAVKKLRGKPGTKVTITIFRKGVDKPFDVTITRAIIKIKAVKYKTIDDLGYIKLTQFKDKASNEVIAALKELKKKNIKGLIFDLRNNPGGLLNEAINVSSIFLPAGKTVVFTKDRDGKERHYRSSLLSYRDLDIPMVVLINEGSASASEIFSGAMKDYNRAIIVGKTSFGKASVQTIIPLNDGSAIKITTARYYTPNGHSIQNVGIKPDIIIPEGKIVVENDNHVIKEKDLEHHLDNDQLKQAGFNISDNETDIETELNNDLQLKVATNILKGLIKYGKKEKTNK
ncbi:carboxyl-terminal protease [Deferribacter desulfuricans SSM1]|uniref:Carboxyl-terminal protease n=1 Tax=Deferribacter desulfuricans (strain DSM 14783 / JCM 11476 / NBRC 101012 / SSM1) TaxID=639282 RepID=D3PE03_DEFDS|nr:S41 family peptidase [Deferribacter desulfuricans]BAI80826.1 carboxyl-terminal protease [Deferribacter desulfuricans SSM1]